MSSLTPPLEAVLQLFQGPLANVRFADIDAAGLASVAAEVASAGALVAQQEAQLGQLRQTLAERQDALLLLAQRALAYARVYAEQDDALSEQLARISLPRAAKPRKLGAKAADTAETTSAVSATDAEAVATAGPSTEDSGAAVEDRADASSPAPLPRKGKRRAGGASANPL